MGRRSQKSNDVTNFDLVESAYAYIPIHMHRADIKDVNGLKRLLKTSLLEKHDSAHGIESLPCTEAKSFHQEHSAFQRFSLSAFALESLELLF